MNIFITGGTGFIGQALCQQLIEQGHRLTVLSRQPKPNTQAVTFCQDFTQLDQFDAVINLAGEPIFDKHWTIAQKQKLYESRILLTQKIVACIQQSQTPPRVFLSASATGIYGDLPQSAKQGEDLTAYLPQNRNSFTATLCEAWEQTALKAQSEQTRVCLLRTGMVLDQSGGALKKMLPLYRLGLGGKIGTGKQHWAWISLRDQIRAILFLLHNPTSQGAYNLVSPDSISNAEFNQIVAKSVHRPAFFAVPKWILKWLLSERSQLLLDNQPLVPKRLLDEGFEFKDTELSKLFSSYLKKSPS